MGFLPDLAPVAASSELAWAWRVPQSPTPMTGYASYRHASENPGYPRQRGRGDRAWRRVTVAIALLWAPVLDAANDFDAQNAPSAAGSGPLDLQIEVETLLIVAGADGQDTRLWMPAGRLRAGDEVHYTIRVTNPGEDAVTDIVVTKRMPFGVHYILGSAVGPACTVQFSIDGGAKFSVPAKLGAVSGSKRASRKIVPADYTHVRWIFGKPLAPNATALLRFRATFT